MDLSGWLGLVQAVATVGALYFAWRTVHESRTAERDRRRERLSSRLGQLSDAVLELDHSARNSHQMKAGHAQTRIRVLLVGTQPLQLPLTTKLSELESLTTYEELIEAYKLAERALDEIREASEQIA